MSRIILDDGEGAPVFDIEHARHARYGKPSKIACEHRRVYADERKNTLTCRDCEAEVNPVWYITMLVQHWNLVESRKKSAEAAVAEAQKRTRTKCQHCGRMTRIHGVW